MKTKTCPAHFLKNLTAALFLGVFLLVFMPSPAVAMERFGSAEAEQEKNAEEEKEAGEEKIVLGWLQSVRLLPSKRRLTAKLDSGAKSSALHAVDIEIIQQGDEEIVRFKVPVERKGETTILSYELPLIKESKVKRHERDELDIRPVVELDFCLDGTVYRALFSLDDRDKFNYPVLLGRRFLERYFLVDPSRTFVKKYRCP